jgi:hypothetical protein
VDKSLVKAFSSSRITIQQVRQEAQADLTRYVACGLVRGSASVTVDNILFG